MSAIATVVEGMHKSKFVYQGKQFATSVHKIHLYTQRQNMLLGSNLEKGTCHLNQTH
jgi:hypothetical protein